MKNILKVLLFSLLISGASLSYADNDALINGTAVAVGVQGSIKTISAGTFTHILSYVAVGTTATISIQIEGSTNNGASYTLCGSASTTLPVPAAPVQCTGVYDHIRVNITVLTGAAPQVLWVLGSNVITGSTGLAATQTQGTTGDGSNPSGTNPFTIGWIKSNGATTFGKSAGYISGNIAGATPQDQILAVGSAYVAYTPAQFGVNALTLPVSAQSALSTIIDTRGATGVTLFTQCGQPYHIWVNSYMEDGTTIGSANTQVAGTVGAASVLETTIDSSNSTVVSNGATATAGNAFRVPKRAMAVSFFNTTASASTCTARALLKY